MIKVGIIGATGYAGGELVRILMGHKDAEIKWDNSAPPAAMPGMITKAASSAASVSKNATFLAEPGISSESLK